MPAPHSLDLRIKAVAAFDRGERKSDICRFLEISRNTLDLWLKRREESASVAPKTDYRRGPEPKINDLEPVYKEKIKSRLDKGFGFIRRHVDQASYIA